MAAYKKFFVKQQKYDGTNYTDVSSVVDTYETYNIVCQEFPFKYTPESKTVSKRDWFDEDGEDVYIPSDGMKFKAYDVDVKFLYHGEISEMKQKIVSFIKFMTGRNTDEAVMLAIYDEYTGIGLRGLYVSNVSDELYEYNDILLKGYAVFKIKFRVTDPVTFLDENLDVVA